MFELASIFSISCWHVLMPGHFKTVLVASWFAGMKRRSLILMALGYGVSHGVLMGGALLSGLVIAKGVRETVSINSIYAGGLYLSVLIGAFLYLSAGAIRARFAGSGNADANRAGGIFLEKKPLISGLALGLIPCGGVLGLMGLGPAILSTQAGLIIPFLAVWSGVVVTVMGLAVLLGLIPLHIVHRRFPVWFPYAGAASICLIIAFYKGWLLWREASFLAY